MGCSKKKIQNIDGDENAAQSKIRQKDLDANYVMQKKLVVKGPTDRNDVQIFPFQ